MNYVVLMSGVYYGNCYIEIRGFCNHMHSMCVHMLAQTTGTKGCNCSCRMYSFAFAYMNV